MIQSESHPGVDLDYFPNSIFGEIKEVDWRKFLVTAIIFFASYRIIFGTMTKGTGNQTPKS